VSIIPNDSPEIGRCLPEMTAEPMLWVASGQVSGEAR
jgi:hypothetical protein